ncbi:hypothetical protein LS996_28600 (plasmid) [Bacillus cereus]|uniref:hypothetical protein n=1 Tax=Bacillus cereus TaxID=1396 RepID=UPI003DA8AF63
MQVEKYKESRAQKVCKLKEIGKRKSKLLQVEKYKESKAQKVCKLKEIGKRKSNCCKLKS